MGKSVDKAGPTAPAPEAASAVVREVQEGQTLKPVTGSRNTKWSANLLNRTLATLSCHGQIGTDDEARTALVQITMDTLAAFEPKDPIEGMIAAQAVAMHHASMECFKRAMNPAQPHEIAVRCRKDGVNLARGFTDMLDALDRHRGKGSKQVVRVERVIVQDGGQAVVGAVASSAALPAAAPSAPLALGQGPAPMAPIAAQEPIKVGRGGGA